jgi:hypothetical protein
MDSRGQEQALGDHAVHALAHVHNLGTAKSAATEIRQ